MEHFYKFLLGLSVDGQHGMGWLALGVVNNWYIQWKTFKYKGSVMVDYNSLGMHTKKEQSHCSV